MLRYQPPFRFAMIINCMSLMEDFHEDLEFRFSLSITSLLRRITARRMGKPITALGSHPLNAPVRFIVVHFCTQVGLKC